MRRIGVTAAILIGISLCQGAVAQVGPEGQRIAHLTRPAPHAFATQVANSLTMRSKLLGMEVTTFSPPVDAGQLARQLDDAIAARYDLIALMGGPDATIDPLLARAQGAGIPVIVLDQPPDPAAETRYLAFVGEDYHKLGRAAGLSMLEALRRSGRDRGNVAIIAASLEDRGAAQRIAGFEQALAGSPGMRIVAIENDGGDTAATKRITKELIARFAANGGLDGIYGMVDRQAVAIIEAAEAAGREVGAGKGELVVVGGSCEPAGIAMIEAGKQYATATRIPARTGWVAADVIADYFNAKPPPKQVLLPVLAINRDNVAIWKPACTF